MTPDAETPRFAETFAAGYLPEDCFRKAMLAADDALAALPPEMWGIVIQAATSLVVSEAIFQGLRGPFGKIPKEKHA